MAASRELKEKIRNLLNRHFNGTEDKIGVYDGYHENVHVIVISPTFRDKSEKNKEEELWKVLESGELTEDEKLKISLALPFSPDEAQDPDEVKYAKYESD